MRDSGAWKPFALFLGIVLYLIGRAMFYHPQPSDTTITTNIPEVGVSFNFGDTLIFRIITALVIFIIIGMALSSARDKRYVSPRAKYVRAGVIEVEGDCDTWIHNWHQVASGSSWTHIGFKHWRVDGMPLGPSDTRELVKNLNSIQAERDA